MKILAGGTVVVATIIGFFNFAFAVEILVGAIVVALFAELLMNINK
jgi:hypothetical protein